MLKVITDSTCDLLPDQVEAHHLTVVPLYVNFDGKLQKDRIEINTPDIFTGVKAGKKIPSTSQPSPEDFKVVYENALLMADHVLSIHISSKMSGTAQSAQLAAKEFEGRVTVFDSETVSVGLGMMAMRASDMAWMGGRLEDILAVLEKVRQKQNIMFTVDTLDYLRMNGRIGGAQAMLGSLLNIKPILAVKNGRVEAAGRVRGRPQALKELQTHVSKFVQTHGPCRVCMIDTPGAEEEARKMAESLKATGVEVIGINTLGAVVATHAGPGTIGYGIEPISL
ncbi:DegV family protein [Deinococcus roseus]|uniref:DegV domain-containing protein n=1 Tax=Deinococcus roseus TaxID=392414 RepID=A0ABQ2CXF4_9DEIO|nr:DegV family protein [Deinococcus roseus]GGJ30405.1 degV domain-containing protein [Deinococcus roseus]